MIAAMARRISSPIIVGRTEELEQLRAAAARGAAGADTPTTLVSGEAGVGKSRLVAELAASARRSACALWSGAAQQSSTCPSRTRRSWPPSRRCFATPMTGRPRPCWRASAPTSSASSPASRRGSPILARQRAAEAMIPGRVFDAVRMLLQRVARELPLVVVFEDLHWADPASLDLIGTSSAAAEAGRDRGHVPQRRAAPAPPAPPVDRGDRARPLGRADRARAPPPSAIVAQAAAILGAAPEPALTDELVRRGGGNAFLTEELLASRSADGRIPRATGVTQVLLARVDALPDGVRPVVDALSVSGAAADSTTRRRSSRCRSARSRPRSAPLSRQQALSQPMAAPATASGTRSSRRRSTTTCCPENAGGITWGSSERCRRASRARRPIVQRARPDSPRLCTMRWRPTT